MPEDKCLLHFLKQTTYSATPDNQVGTDADHEVFFPGEASQRTVPTPGGAVYYVRKFGTDYLITDVTDIEDPVDANMTFTIKALDGTTLGSRTGGGAFVDGSTLATAQGCYMEIAASGGAVTVLAGIDVDTDVDVGGITFVCATDAIADGDTLTLYLSDTGSTYYDSSYMYGGDRHTPAVGDARLPFFHPYDPLNDGAWGNGDGIEILDSATYSFPYKDDGGTWRYELPLSVTPCYLYAAAGATPRITGVIGASVYREVSEQHNNITAVFFNENGAGGAAGTWQDPFNTAANAIAGRGGLNVVYGGTGATATGGIFSISASLSINAFTFGTEYGYTPKFNSTANGIAVQVFAAGGNAYGWTVDANGYVNTSGFSHRGVAGGDEIRNCSAYNCTIRGFSCQGGNASTNKMEHCFVENCVEGFYNSNTFAITWVLRYNIATGCTRGFNIHGANNIVLTCEHNLAYANSHDGFEIHQVAGSISGTFENNTSTQNVRMGLNNTGGAPAATFRDCVIYNNTLWDLYRSTTQPTITESVYGTNAPAANDWTIGAGCVNSDPKFCKITSPFKFGISSDSPAYRSDTSSDDMGAQWRLIEVNNDNVQIEGIEIDGGSQFNNAIYIADTADHTGMIVRWCNIGNFQGIAIDVYDDGTDTSATVSNNLIHNNGNGIKFAYGGNTIEENCFYRCSVYGVWADYTGQLFNHNAFYLNQYGIYIESNGATIAIKNSIFNANSLYGIDSEVAVAVTYCCITDGVGANVDDSDASNITDKPLFIDTDSGSENLNIKTTEGGYSFESACKDAAEFTTFPDIGAFDVVRTVLNESWQKYQLATNPTNMNMGLISKSLRSIEEGLGSLVLYAKGHKRVLPFIWDSNASVTEAQRKTIDYMNTLIPTRENGITKDQARFRVHLAPTTLHDTGTATVDATALTLTDITQSWIVNELKAWWAGVEYASGTATGTITASTRILQVAPSPGWTNDQWIGYYFYYGQNYYYITDNDADELTLSDPDGTLADVAGIDWTIEKYFRIASNTATVATVEDPDGGLVDGSYAFYIDFIECRLQTSKSAYTQLPRFKWSAENQKSGQRIVFEES